MFEITAATPPKIINAVFEGSGTSGRVPTVGASFPPKEAGDKEGNPSMDGLLWSKPPQGKPVFSAGQKNPGGNAKRTSKMGPPSPTGPNAGCYG